MPFFGVPIRNGLPIGLGSSAGFGIAPFEPYSLFENGEQGAWYDPSDFSTLFDDSAGITPVTGVEQFVGLMLDKSKGLVLGPELVTNPGPFANTTGWIGSNATIASSGGKLVVTDTGGLSGFSAYQAFNVTAGKLYKLSTKGRVVSGTSTVFQLVFRNGADAATSSLLGGFTVQNPVTGVIYEGSAYYYATSTATVYLHCRGFFSSAPVLEYEFANVSEVAGNHAFQTNSLKRPKLAARYNILLNSATLATQNVTTQATNYTLRFDGGGTVTLSGTATGTLSAGVNTFTATAGTLTLTVSGTVTSADLRPSSQATGLIGPLYQAITTATVYDTAGFLPYLAFDGLSWSMGTNSIDPGAIDKAQVFAGVRKLSDVRGVIVESSSSYAANAGSILIIAKDATNTIANSYGFAASGTTANQLVATTYVPPCTNVLSCAFDIAQSVETSEIVPRIDGLTPTITTTGNNLGTGNFNNHPFYIGGRNNASLFFNGWLSSLIVRFGANLSQSQIEATEAWVNSRTGAY